MLKKLLLCVLTVLLVSFAFGTAYAEKDLPELSLEELIRWKESTRPDTISEDDVDVIIRGNLYEEYYGFTPKAVGDPLRSYMTCDRPMFMVGATSTITAQVSGGSAPYQFDLMPYRRSSSVSGSSYSSFGLRSSQKTLAITPDDDYRYLIVTTVYDSNGDYITYRAVYDTVTENSLSDSETIGGKVRSVIASVVKSSMTDRQKALAVHNWLTRNAGYDNTLKNHDPNGVLLLQYGVCESYARAFQMFMSELGIPCVYISSNSMNHAWNMIYIEGGWYHVDVTWDDPCVNGNGTEPIVSGYESTTYFCVTDEFLSGDHTWDKNAAPPSGKGPMYPDPEPITAASVSVGNNSLTITNGTSPIRQFTAPEDGVFIFETIGSKDTYAYLYDEDMNELDHDDQSGTDDNFRITCGLTKNQVVYIGVKYYNSTESGSETLRITRVVYPSVSVGDNSVSINAGEITKVRFKALSDGQYTFETIGSNDTYGYIYDASLDELAKDDDSGTGTNFRITRELTKGQIVYIGVKYYSSTRSGTETLQITAAGSDPIAPSATLTTLTGRSFSTLPNSGKPKLLVFTMANCGNNENVIKQLSGYDLSALDVVIADGANATIGTARNFYRLNVPNLTGATMAYGAKAYLWRLMALVDPDVTKITMPAVFYIGADNTIQKYTTGDFGNVITNVRDCLGVTLKKTDFAGKRLTLPSGTVTIESKALAGTAAELIVIPADCTSIAADAFDGCRNLKIILNHSQVSITPPQGVVVTDIPLKY